jgi:hypothetical protein
LFRQELSKSKISQANIAISIHQYILWFEISVHNLFSVQIAKSQCDLGGNKLDSWLIEPLYFVEIVVDVTSRHIL